MFCQQTLPSYNFDHMQYKYLYILTMIPFDYQIPVIGHLFQVVPQVGVVVGV